MRLITTYRILCLSLALLFIQTGLGAQTHALRVQRIDSLLKNMAFEQAQKEVEQGLVWAKAERGLGDTLYGHYQGKMASIYLWRKDFVQALAWNKKALELYQNQGQTQNLSYVSLLIQLGEIQIETANYKQAYAPLDEALAILKTLGQTRSPIYAQALLERGSVDWRLGNFISAEAYWLEMKALAEEEGFTEKDQAYSICLSNLSILYFYITGDQQQAEDLQIQSTRIQERISGKKHLDYINRAANLAWVYMETQRYTQAQAIFEECLDLLKIMGINDGVDYAYALSNLSIAAFRQNKLDEALRLGEKVKFIRARDLGTKHPLYAQIVQHLAMVYVAKKDYSKALALDQEMVALYEYNFGKQHPLYFNALLTLMRHLEASAKEAELVLVLERFFSDISQQPLSLNITRTWADSLKSVQEPILERDLLLALESVYRLNQRKALGADAKAVNLIITDLAQYITQRAQSRFTSEQDKLRVMAEGHTWMLRSLEHLQPQQAELAFERAEDYKAGLLLQATQHAQAYRFGNLPERLVEREKQLQAEKTTLQAKLLEVASPSQKDSLRALLNDINIEIRSFQAELQAKYPAYTALKYESKKPPLSSLQAALDDKTAIIEYVIAQEQIYIFYLDRKGLKLKQQPKSAQALQADIKQLHSSLSQYSLIREKPQEAYEAYTQVAYRLYQELLAPVLEGLQGIEHLIIIPDGELGHLPFETFLQAPAPASANYADLAYLLKSYRISYNYSARLWQENRSKKRQKHSGRLLGMAANYEQQAEAKRLPFHQRLRSSLSPLPGARAELQALAQTLKGDFYFDLEASEAKFKAQAADYGLIHLAMHGLLNRKTPILSSLAFTENGDSLQDGFLQAYEISQLELRADLVVLSACETGYGRFEKGNGTASLARAFMFAGVPALVVSLWAVNDQSTALIMPAFYKYLGQGLNKAEALRQAKLDYLEQTEGIAQHPAYWSAFVQIGDDQAIELQAQVSNYWPWALGGLVLLMLVLWLYRRFR